jgi:predicted esterase
MACRPMPLSEPSRVFISYARKDGAALAQRLQEDLQAKGYCAWLDTQRIDGGRVWSTEIEDALDVLNSFLRL